jgi:cell division protease FtsH
MNFKKIRSGAIYVLLLIALGAFLYTSLTNDANSATQTVPIDQIAEDVRQGRVKQLAVKDDRVTATLRGQGDGPDLVVQSRKESETGLVQALLNLGVTPEQLKAVDIRVAEPQFWENWSGLLLALLPLILLGAFFYFIMRQAQGAGNQAFSFGKSRARMFTGDRPTVTFNDVAGNDEAKQELQELSNFSRSRKNLPHWALVSRAACSWSAHLAQARR